MAMARNLQTPLTLHRPSTTGTRFFLTATLALVVGVSFVVPVSAQSPEDPPVVAPDVAPDVAPTVAPGADPADAPPSASTPATDPATTAEPVPPVPSDPPPPPVPPPQVVSPLWLQNPWTGDTKLVRVPEPDTSLWNATRIEDYEDAVAQSGDPALAVLSINRLGMKIPVYNGTDEFNLDRGLGRIRGMARIGEEGHLGISGHRDGYFRALKDLVEGDRIMVRTTNDVTVFEVQGFSIVDKHDASILKESMDDWRLTLVTCYPFYFVGNAPQRYIVHATPVTTVP